MLTVIPDAILSLIYPQDCRICKQSVDRSADGVACSDCWGNTRIFSNSDIICSKCGVFLQQFESSVETFCRRCDDHFYDSARAVGVYENALAAAILELKRRPRIAKTVRRLFQAAFQTSHFCDASLIVPVPLSAKRLVERGFNQALVLAKVITKETGIALDEHSLIRTLHTPMHRAAMDKKAREMTVRNAFKVTRPRLIENKNILLIDDVLTSGSTASHCAKALKKAARARLMS